jgi:outer membrane murein-binding lipoprotein Lpp
MTTVIASVLSVVVASLLIAGSFENAAKMQQAMAGNSNSLQST